jgi:hypothetical protein
MKQRIAFGLVAAALAAALPSAFAAADVVPAKSTQSADDLADVGARYRAVLAQLEDIDRQRKALDELIARARKLENLRGTGTGATGTGTGSGDAQPGSPATPAASSQSPPPVVAVERKDELEAQRREMPDLPRVSNDVGGVLTPKHRLVLEPAVSYAYSSVNKVSIEGFTILPALLVGVIDVTEADRNTYMTSLSARYGVTRRFEMEVRGSYLYRDDATRSRQYLKDSIEDSVFNASGVGAGDWELGMRYQFTRRKPTSPYLVGNLRYKAANGTDPFKIATTKTLAGDPQLADELPTGSGFKSLSPSLTFIYPTDPVVFFGSVGYVWTEKADKGLFYDDKGKQIGFGMVDPGDAVRLNFGLGLGLNDRSSLSISYQLDKFSRTFIETASVQKIVGSDATVGRLLIGYSLRMPGGAPLNLAIGIGTTGDANDSDLTFRIPFTLGN